MTFEFIESREELIFRLFKSLEAYFETMLCIFSFFEVKKVQQLVSLKNNI